MLSILYYSYFVFTSADLIEDVVFNRVGVLSLVSL